METYPTVIRRDLEKAETQSGYADFMQIYAVVINGETDGSRWENEKTGACVFCSVMLIICCFFIECML